MYLASTRLMRTSLVIRLSAVLMCAALATACLAGCLSQQELAYHKAIRELGKRWNDLDNKFEETEKALEAQGDAMMATKPTSLDDAMGRINQLLNIFLPKFQEHMAELLQIQADMNNLQVPPKYSTAHSIYVSGMSSLVVSIQQILNGLDMMRQVEKIEDALAIIKNAPGYANQGIDNLNKANGMVFSTNWGLIVGVIIGVLIIVAAIIIFFVYLSRRRRYQPGYIAPGPVGAYPRPGYPPPPVAYRSPSEAYPPLPGDIYSAPVPQGYPTPPQPGYPPAPEAGSPPPGTPPESPPKQPVTCPRCGAEITTAGAFCPSCNAMLPGI